MARRIKISAGEINVRLHPHDSDRYADYISALFELRRAIKIRGDRFAMLSLLDRSSTRQGQIHGILTTFTQIDKDAPWFDLSDLREASTEKVSQIHIPDGLYPNASSFYFLFDLRKHRFYIQTYSKGKTLSVSSAYRVLVSLSQQPDIVRRFGEAQISIVQSRNALEQLFEMDIIKRVKITILKPNADVFSDTFEEDIEEHLAETNSKKIEIAYEAEAGKSFQPNAEVMEAAQPALSNGRVTAEGRDEHGPVKRSTEEFPKILNDKYDPEVINEAMAFHRLIRDAEEQ